ncbi:hypothetical protein [Aeromicrobium sp. 9AM]|uniref:hypothetical protein n=1 Tax=Aeromicrobium sp. 9AM TaxID=2653126 RepID=UPI00135CBB15|nr:hypothetical protein [Aeromicrobium sp. 9AM]
MNRDEALEVLQLDANPSADEIQTAFRRFVAEGHPDRGGDANSFSRVVEARDTLVQSSTALVPMNQVREIVLAATRPMEEQARRTELRNETNDVVRGAVRVRTSEIRHQQRRLATLTFMSAMVGAASQVGRLEPFKQTGVSNSLGVAFAAIALALGLMIALTNQNKAQIQADIEDIADTMNDKAVLVRTLHDVLGPGATARPWSPEELHGAVGKWVHESGESRPTPIRGGVSQRLLGPTGRARPLPHFARRMGVNEFGRLLLAKAKERGVVIESENWDNDHLSVSYQFNRPSKGEAEGTARQNS